MKAMLCKELGHPSTMVLEEVPAPVPGKKEVLVTIKACSVNFPDTLIVQGLYQFKPSLPFSPGSDVAGVVKAVGEGVKHVKPGDDVFGLVSNGGFAEEVVVPAASVFPKPPMMDYKTAASFMMAYGTSYYALKDRANLKEGETLLVLGASGGVGLAAVELGKAMGAKVIAAAKGANVVYDPVGGDYTEAALRATAWEGRFLIIGFPAGIAKIPMNLPLLKGCQIVGVFWGSFAQRSPQENMKNTMDLITMFGKGQLKPHIGGVYSLANSKQALIDMMDRKVKGKVIIEP